MPKIVQNIRWNDHKCPPDTKYARRWMEERASIKDAEPNAIANHGHGRVTIALARVRAFLLHEKVRGSLEEQEGSRLRRYQLRERFDINPTFRPNCFTDKTFVPKALSGRRVTFSFDGIFADYVFDDAKCGPIVDKALAGSKVHIQVIDEVVEEFTSQGKPLTLALAHYVNARLKQLREMQSRSRGRPRVTEQRDVVIAWAVYDTHSVFGFGLSVTAETKGEPAPSAAEIVADALHVCDINLSADAVYRIWLKYSEVELLWQRDRDFDLVGSSGGRELWDASNPRQWG